MKELRRALIIWAVLMGLFLLVVIWASRYGERAAQTIESRMKLTQAVELKSSNRLAEAIQNYEDIVSADEEAFRPRALLVEAYVRTGRFTDALSHAQRAVEVAPPGRQLQPLLLLSRVCREMGLWDRASSAAERAVEESSTCGEAHYELAKAAEAMRNYPRMVDELEEVAKLGARGSSAEYEEAWTRRRERVAQYGKQIRPGGVSPEVHYKAGIDLKEAGSWQEAVEAFTKAVEADRDHADAGFWLGVQAEVQGNLAGAIVKYREVVETCPDHLDGLLNLERALLLKRVDEQVADSRTWYRLGQLNFRFKNWREAAGDFSKTIELEPDLADAHFRLGLVFQVLGRPSEARAAYTEAVRLLPTHARALLLLRRLESQR